jgi:tripartite-type tricarboxylate transporter receptor subunit TctC
VLRILLACVLAAPLAVLAQFPGKPIRVVVPFPAGSATDTITRILSNSVSQSVGQPLLVENKAGADGAIAAAEVAKALPDGYTLLMATNSPMSAVPAMKKNPPYDPVADFTPITDIGRYTFFIVIHPSVPAKTLGELIEYARAAAVRAGKGPNEFEIQFLYGIRRDLQQQLAASGYRVRVYIPYGSAWYPYLTRRMAERPANLLFFLRALAGR